MMKKIGITFLVAFLTFACAHAQDYNTGIGLRGGFANGITLKHFVSEKAAFEGIIASRWRGLELTALYEIHGRAFDTNRLNWYAGFGGHVGFWDGRYTKWGEDRSYTVVGLDGIIGMEYNFLEIPFNLSIDWKPSMNFYGHSGFWGDGGAFSIRYIF